MQLGGPAKAAMFLLSLPEEHSVKILSHLDELELKQLREAISELGTIDSGTIDSVYGEFAEAFKSGVTSSRGGGEYLRSLVSRAFGEEKAGEVFSDLPQLPPPSNEPQKPGEFDKVDPTLLRVTLTEEHPQVAAVILAHVEPSLAAGVLEDMPEVTRSDLLRRIANLSSISGAAFDDARRVLNGLELKETSEGSIEGVDSAATILNAMDQATAESVLEHLNEEDPDNVDALKNAMFTFENLLAADTRGLQALLREVPSDTLLAGLKLASDELKEKIFSCMSSRAADILRDELEVMPPMRVSAVEAAQQQVVEIAMRLIAEGKIAIEGRGEGLV